MKVILYMATTANGYIAKENDDTSFVSENSWKEYKRMIEESDCIIMGRRTYEIMPPEEFVRGKVYIVFTTKTNLEKKIDNIRFTNENPGVILQSLEKEGFDKVLVAGGGMLNGSFMSEGLIDEVFIDVEPVAFGKGTKLFGESDFDAKLRLVDTKQLSPNEIQLHYEVLK